MAFLKDVEKGITDIQSSKYTKLEANIEKLHLQYTELLQAYKANREFHSFKHTALKEECERHEIKYHELLHSMLQDKLNWLEAKYQKL